MSFAARRPRYWQLLAAIGALGACSVSARHEAEPAARQAPASAPSAAPRTELDAAEPTVEWDEVRLENESPLCVFANHAALDTIDFARDVKRQTLRAGSSVVFGVFTPGCRSEACDGPPTLHCSVERSEPNTLVVQSRLVYSHKRGTTCTSDCLPVVAGCESEPLAPGQYTVRYGARSFALRVPSTLRKPCFALE